MKECGAQAVDVGSGIYLLPPHLLGSNVVRCAPDAPAVLHSNRAGQTKVHQFGGTAVVQKNILGFDIAVQQSRVGGSFKRGRDIPSDAHHHGRGRR